jgi:hypothetical protein
MEELNDVNVFNLNCAKLGMYVYQFKFSLTWINKNKGTPTNCLIDFVFEVGENYTHAWPSSVSRFMNIWYRIVNFKSPTRKKSPLIYSSSIRLASNAIKLLENLSNNVSTWNPESDTSKYTTHHINVVQTCIRFTSNWWVIPDAKWYELRRVHSQDLVESKDFPWISSI